MKVKFVDAKGSTPDRATEGPDCAGLGAPAHGYDLVHLRCKAHRARLDYTGWSVGGVQYYRCPVAHERELRRRLLGEIEDVLSDVSPPVRGVLSQAVATHRADLEAA